MFLVCALVVLATTMLSLAAATPARLHVAVAFTGICFGSFWSFAPVVVGELFGEKHAGAQSVIFALVHACADSPHAQAPSMVCWAPALRWAASS